MSVYKQGGIWWYEFYIGRKRYRSSTLSSDKTIAQKIEAEHRESLARTGVKLSPTLNAIRSAKAMPGERREGGPASMATPSSG
jgi:hypothetical protein